MYYIVETFVLYARTSGAQEIARFVVLCLKMAMAVFGKEKSIKNDYYWHMWYWHHRIQSIPASISPDSSVGRARH
jgi:hypothetical protein